MIELKTNRIIKTIIIIAIIFSSIIIFGHQVNAAESLYPLSWQKDGDKTWTAGGNFNSRLNSKKYDADLKKITYRYSIGHGYFKGLSSGWGKQRDWVMDKGGSITFGYSTSAYKNRWPMNLCRY